MDKVNNNLNCIPEEIHMCPECGSENVKIEIIKHHFYYGKGDDQVELSANIPLSSCEDCGFSFTDEKADELCHEAICKHLEVLTPSQIRSLRKLYDYSQVEFASISSIGEATLSRWERGVLIQNKAYDNYLYLLGFKENLTRLQHRNNIQTIPETNRKNGVLSVFKAVEVDKGMLERQKSFRL